MAELFADPSFWKNNGQQPAGNYTGVPEVDRELDKMPEEERQAAIAEITAPPTGEEIASMIQSKLAVGEVANISREQYRLYKAYSKTKETDVMEAIGMGADMVWNDLQKAAGSFYDKPIESIAKLTPSAIEAFSQGTRSMYGMLAESQDPNSTLFRVKNAIFTGSDEDAEYEQFMQALNFNAKSTRLMQGKETLVVDKDLINPEVTQAMSYIADPSLFIPFEGVAVKGAQLVGMAEGLAKASARASAIKQMVIGGTLRWGVGAPIEVIGGATRATIDAAVDRGSRVISAVTGMQPAEIATTARMTGLGTIAAEAAGVSVPFGTGVAETYVGASTLRGVGEAIGAVGEQMMRGERGVLSYAQQALRESAEGGAKLTPQAENLLKAIDFVDPMFSYSADITKGVTQGAAIGGGLGYLGGGEEGMAQGIGAGAVLGGVGAGFGRIYADISGATKVDRMRITTDLGLNILSETNPTQAKDYMTLRAVAQAKGMNVDGYISGLLRIAPDLDTYFKGGVDHKAEIKARGFDPDTYDGSFVDQNGRRLFSMAEFEKAEGFVIDKAKDGRVTFGINLDNLKKNTVPHEAFHTIFRSVVMEPEFQKRMTESVLGAFDKDGKQISAPRVSQAEAVAFFDRYLKALHKGEKLNEQRALLKQALEEYYRDGQTKVMAEDGKTPFLANLSEEFGAYYFTQFIEGKPLDYLFLGGELGGVRGIMQSVQDGWLDYWEGRAKRVEPKFDMNNPDGIDYAFKPKGGKRVRVGAIDYLMQDLVRAATQRRQDGSINLSRMSRDTREQFLRSQGLDGVGETRAKPFRPKSTGGQDTVKIYNKTFGPQVHAAILAMPENLRPKVDGNGDFTGPLSKEVIEQMVSTGHVSREMGNKIQVLQDMASGKMQSNIAEMGYVGWSMQTDVGPNPPRVYGNDVPYKRRKVMILGVESKIGPKGMSFTAKTLDWQVIETRANNLWSDTRVRNMWGDDRGAFVQDFFRYLSNASKTDAEGRVPSGKLWAENGDAKRDIMQQMAGIPRNVGETYAHPPIAEIHEDILNSVMNLTVNRMSDVRVTGDNVFFDAEKAAPFIRVNMKVADMPYEDTPNGKIFTDKQSGFRFTQTAKGVTAFDRHGEFIGSYANLEDAGKFAKRVYERQQAAMKEVAVQVTDEASRGITHKSKSQFVEDNVSRILNNEELLTEYLKDFIKKHFPKIKEDTVISFARDVSKINKKLRIAEEKAKSAYRSITEARIEVNKMVEDKFQDDWDNEVLRVHGEEGLKRYKQLQQNVEVLREKWKKEYGEPLELLTNESKAKIDELWSNYDEGIGMEHYFNTDKGRVNIIELYALINKGINKNKSDIKGAMSVAFGSSSSNRLFNLNNDSLAKLVVDSNLRPELNSKWEAMFPRTFRSRLLDKVQSLHKANPNLSYQGLIKKFLRDSSNGYRFYAEAEAMGLLDFLRSKINPAQRIEKQRDAQGDWTGGIKTTDKPFADSKIRGGRTDLPLDLEAVADFIKNNDIKLQVDDGARANISDTSGFVQEGTTLGYNETAIRMPQKYAHGISGHYGPDVVVHHRSTVRNDINSEQVRFVDEIQANNAKGSDIEFDPVELKRSKAGLEAQKKALEIGDRYGLWTTEEMGQVGKNLHRQQLDIFESMAGTMTIQGVNLLNARDINGERAYNVVIPIMRRYHVMMDSAVSEISRYGGKEPVMSVDAFLDLVSKDPIDIVPELGSELGITSENKVIGPEAVKFMRSKDGLMRNLKNARFYAERTQKAIIEAAGVYAKLDRVMNPLLSAQQDLNQSRQAFTVHISDGETRIQQMEKAAGAKPYPLQEISEWSAVAIKDIITKSIQDGIDLITITHPDDSPTKSGMAQDARHADYGRIFPQVAQKIVGKYGIEVKQRNELPALTEAQLKDDAFYRQQSDKRIKAQEAAMEVFKKTQGQGESPDVISELARQFSRTAEDLHKEFYDETKSEWLRDWSDKVIDLLKQVKSPELKEALLEVKGAVGSEAYAFQTARSSIYDKLDPSVVAIDRGMSFRLNKEIKEAVMQGELRTAYKPSEAGEEGGRRYTPEQMAGEFIGRYASENKGITKGLKIFYGKIKGTEYSEGITIRDKNGDAIAHIDFSRHKDTASVNGSEVYVGYQGKGYGNLIYSELSERLRSEGIRILDGWITDDMGRPQKIRRKIIDAQNEIVGGERTKVSAKVAGGRDVESYLKSNAWYKPLEGDAPLRVNFSPDEVKKNLRSLQSAIDRQSDKDKVPAGIKKGVGRLIQAIERQRKEDVKNMPQAVKEGFKALADAVDAQADMDKVPAGVRKGLRLLFEAAQYEDLKPQQAMPKPTASEEQLASGIEALGRAVGVKGQVRRQPKPQAKPEAQAAIPDALTPETQPNTPPTASMPEPVRPTPEPTSTAWMSWTQEKTETGGFIKNALGYVIVVNKGKFKVYNPAKVLVGIYEDEESAKRRVLKDMPRR